MNNTRILTAILISIALLIPLMWVLGHRANNSLLALLFVFALFRIFFKPFAGTIDGAVMSVARSSQRSTKIIISLVAVAMVLVILHIINDARYNFWNLDREEGVATLVAAVLLALNVIAVSVYRKKAATKADRWKWLLVGILFALLAFDELSEMHSWIPLYLYHLFGGEGDTIGGGFVIWVIVLSPFIVAVVVSLVCFFFGVLGRKSQLWALAALLCWCLVLVLEGLGGNSNIPWLYRVAVEEFLEMFGSTLFLISFLTQLRHSQPAPDATGV